MIIDKINQWAKICPERKAHQHRDQVLTYSNLKESSDALAVWIYETCAQRRIERGTPIVVYGHKDTAMLVFFIACTKAGYPYVPVDSSVPISRLRQIIEVSECAMLLSTVTVPNELNDLPIIIREHELSDPDFVDYLGQVPSSDWQVLEHEVYYIIYTSGSTGIPKGVQISLGALESFLAWVNSAYRPTESEEVFLNQAPFSFDLSVMDLYMSLSTGGTLWSIDKELIANPRELFINLANSNVSYWVSTPSFAELCLMDNSFNQQLLPNIRKFLFCGEVLTPDCVLKLTQRFPQALVENLYGPTEATVATSNLTITEDILEKYNPLPVGKPKPDGQIVICDPELLTKQINETNGHLERLPDLFDGERGEIVIIGPHVSLGYLNNRAQTHQSFFSIHHDGENLRAYRSGDAGILQEGLLFYNGRLDFQIKLHGYRIELGDIEENIRNIEWVDNVVVLPIVRNGRTDYLQAFIVANIVITSEFEQTKILRQNLKVKIPDYMIPRKIRFISKMPITSNGKADRQALLRGSL